MIIVGAKGHAKEILDVLQSQKEYLCFFDNMSEDLDPILSKNHLILRTKEDVVHHLKKDNRFILGLGNPQAREKMAYLFKSWGGQLTSAISTASIISQNSAVLGDGLNIMHSVVVYGHSQIGEGCLINTGASVHHDSIVGAYCEISPGARILGGCVIGDLCNIGSGAIILPNVIVGKNVIVGAGAVVTKNVEDNTTIVGVPAKPIKHNK
jgi:sugar O-acyltransferase (sialic acid O-acetyltransferase NeuD family)